MSKNRDSWLDTLDKGSLVVVSSRASERLCRVDRLTKTQIVIGNSKFRRRDGFGIGDYTYDRPMIREATPEARQRALRSTYEAMVNRTISSLKISRLTDESLFLLAKTLKEMEYVI